MSESARHRDLYLTTHNTHKSQISIPHAGFEPTIPESQRPQTHSLDGAATGLGRYVHINSRCLYTCIKVCRRCFKCDGTRAETRFRLSAKRTSPFTSTGGVSSVDYLQLRCAPSAVVMLDTPCSEVL